MDLKGKKKRELNFSRSPAESQSSVLFRETDNYYIVIQMNVSSSMTKAVERFFPVNFLFAHNLWNFFAAFRSKNIVARLG
jgi:hypothetical protein